MDTKSVCLMLDEKVIGKLEIYKIDDTYSLSIYIKEEYQSKGFSKLMWKEMIKKLDKENTRSDQMFFIDADASDGYWDHIGMKLNRYGYDYSGHRNLEGRGYHKVITLQELKKYIF